MDELKRKRAWVLSATLLLNLEIEFRYYWQPNVEDYHLCIYSN